MLYLSLRFIVNKAPLYLVLNHIFSIKPFWAFRSHSPSQIAKHDLIIALSFGIVFLKKNYYKFVVSNEACVYTPETRQSKALNRSVGELHSFLGCETVGTLRGGLKYIYLIQRSQLMVVRWSETTRNYVGPPDHFIQWWTTKISILIDYSPSD